MKEIKNLYRVRGGQWFGRKKLSQKEVRVFRKTFPSLRLLKVKHRRK